ncbi:MAG: tetratricopeptide repeat protein [Verrucomicrobiota bacterium]
MNVPSPDERGEDKGAAETEPGYLFHMQKPPPRPAPHGVRPPARPESWLRHPPDQNIWTNVRIVTTAVIGMVIFLLLAVYASVKSWQMKEQRAVRGISSSGPAAAGHARSEVGGRRGAGSTNGLLAAFSSDDEAIRQATLLARQADALAGSGQNRRAVELYEQALGVWPFLAEAKVNLGRLCLRTRNYPKAQSVLQRAYEDNPSSPELANDLGAAHFQQKNIDRALKCFEAAVQMDPDLAASHFNMALCYLAKSDRERAAAAVERFLELRPGDPMGLKEKAYLRAAGGDYAGAMEILRTALKTAPGNPLLLFDAAATAALMGEPADAIMHLKKAQALTSPAAVYLVYQQPAFREIRFSEPGKYFEKQLAEDARRQPARSAADITPQMTVEPMLSQAPL